MNEILQGVLDFIFSNAGWLIVVGLLLFVWGLLTTHKKGVLFVLAAVFIIFPLIIRYAPGVWARAGVFGKNDAQGVLCAEYGGSFCDGGGTLSSSSSSASASGDGVRFSVSSSAGLPQKTLRADALAIWISAYVNPTPVDWLQNPSQNDLPKGVRCDVAGDGAGGKQKEVFQWKCYSTNPALGLTPVEFVANGYWTRESRSWNIKSPGGIANGTGSWESCAECWEVPVTTGATTMTTTVAEPLATVTTGGGDVYVVSATDGATVRIPTNQVCKDSDPKSGSIPEGMEVTIVATFPGATVDGVSLRGLTLDGKCIHLAALSKK